jgi:pyrroline-5-carboxylate reductase
MIGKSSVARRQFAQADDGGTMGGDAALRIGFLGAGKMATALARGWLAARLVRAEDMLASDPLIEAQQAFHANTGVRAIASNHEVVAASEMLILAVKPQSMSELFADIRSTVSSRHLIVSIAAGITLRQLGDGLGADRRLVRVMPNTGCLVGASASAYSPSKTATSEDIALVDRLLNAVGKAFRLPEKLLDAVTGLSGSGPAFVFVIIEALSDGGVKMGLPRDVATALAAQTVYGAAKMVLETSQHTGVLRDMVSSPGGTTIAGLHALERGGVRAALISTIEAATRRAMELSQE